MFFQRKRSKKTEAKLRRARTRRIINSLENDTLPRHQDSIRKALIHLLEKEL
jgi:vacuolar-type H+-ATPase subunit D/Vma8